MSASASIALSQVQDLATQIRRALPKGKVFHPCSPPLVQLDPLQLKSPQYELLLQALASHDISAECQQALISLFESKIGALRLLYLDTYQEVLTSLHYQGQPDEHFFGSFRAALEHKFQRHTGIMWNGIIGEVRRLTGASQSSTSGASKYGSDSLAPSADTRAGRGHDSEAIRILEQAFGITPNITQAEKFRLAEVTGLQPKQVTIWVSTYPFLNATCISMFC